MKFVLRSLALGLLAVTPLPAMAQTQSAPGSTAAAPQQGLLKAEELDALLAPMALYSDTLLAEVLMASTYPLEVVEASCWADEHKSLKGQSLKDAVDKQKWDDSVKSLTATPSVLSTMSSKLSWTQKLGDAVLAQQNDVMDSVQRLRARAQAQKKLETTKEQRSTSRTEQNSRSSSSSRRSPTPCTCLTTIRRWFTARGLTRPILRIITRRLSVITPAPRSRPDWPSARASPSAPGRRAEAGVEASAGATTTSTSTSTTRPTSTTSGSTIRITATARATTTRTSPINSTKAIRHATARKTAWTSAATAVSRSCVPAPAAAARRTATGPVRAAAMWRTATGPVRAAPVSARILAKVAAIAAIGRAAEVE